jgi:hypothetical protein
MAAGVEVRAHSGQLLRIVAETVAEEIVANGLGKHVGPNVWLMPGLELSNMRAIRTGLQRLPDLERMRVREPERYTENWRGTLDARTGHGALGRTGGLADAARIWESCQPLGGTDRARRISPPSGHSTTRSQ